MAQLMLRFLSSDKRSQPSEKGHQASGAGVSNRRRGCNRLCLCWTDLELDSGAVTGKEGRLGCCSQEPKVSRKQTGRSEPLLFLQSGNLHLVPALGRTEQGARWEEN